MRKTLIQTLLAAFCAILAHTSLEGGGVMLINMRNAMLSGGWKNPYVTNGLIAMWDGEWNAGGGVHDANATTWKNLVEESPFEDGRLLGTYQVEDSRITFSSGAMVSVVASSLGTIKSSPFTVEMVCVRRNTLDYRRALYMDFVVLPRSNTSLGSGYCSIFTYNNQPYYNGNGCSTQINQDTDLPYNTATSFTYSADNSGNLAFYFNGILKYSEIKNVAPRNIRGLQTTYTATTDSSYYAIRRYSRALTATEIAANYAVDRARFNLPDAT